MNILLTEVKTGLKVSINAGLIMWAQRIVGNKLEKTPDCTKVVTSMQSKDGLMSLQVQETPEEVGKRVNAALANTALERYSDLLPLMGFMTQN